jgi:hypothetical protein
VDLHPIYLIHKRLYRILRLSNHEKKVIVVIFTSAGVVVVVVGVQPIETGIGRDERAAWAMGKWLVRGASLGANAGEQ